MIPHMQLVCTKDLFLEENMKKHVFFAWATVIFFVLTMITGHKKK